MTTQRVGRRQKLRAEMLAAINDAAREQINEHGPGGLSLRAVASAVGLSSAGIYRYYASHDELLTALIAESFTSLAEALAEAGSGAGTPADSFIEVASAYRRWAVDHRPEFALIFGSSIPHYRAPAGGPTSLAARRVGRELTSALCRVWGVDPGPPGEAPEGIADPAVPDDFLPTLLAAYGQLHGLVTLEVFGHLPWLGPDPEPAFRTTMRRLLPAGGG